MSDAVKSPLEMFYRWEQETPDHVILRQPRNLEWTEYTWAEVADQVRRIASFLRSKGWPEGSRVAIWSANSKDWPKTPHKLGGELRRIATSFRALGVDIQIAEKAQRDGVHVLIKDNRTPPDTPPANKDTQLSSQCSQSPVGREHCEQSEGTRRNGW